MKKNYIFALILSVVCSLPSFAAQYTIITTGNFTYSPATTNANVGDTITISASTTHPLVQVDQSTWNSNGATPMSGGWGTKTSTYTFTIMAASDIYFVCANHVSSMGMKGMISVSTSGIGEPVSQPARAFLFPNPSNGQFSLLIPSGSVIPSEIIVFNLLGQEVAKRELNGLDGEKVTLDLPDGRYFYRFYSDGRYSDTQTAIIER